MNADVRNRYRAFWNREAADRALLYLVVPSGTKTQTERPISADQKWGDAAYRYAALERTLTDNRYVADAFPRDWINLGPGALAAMIGSDFDWDMATVWFGHTGIAVNDWADFEKVKLYEDAAMYKLAFGLTELFVKRAEGRYTVGMTDLGGNLDILASLRGTENLLMDMLDYPEEVKRAITRIDDLWITVYDRLHTILHSHGQQGMTSWMPVWCEERYYPMQCDISCMMSPDAFDAFVLPSLKRISSYLGHSIYHLDGEGAIQHLDKLLAIDHLDAIQWVPGDGASPHWADKWFPMYERVQRAGRNLVLSADGVDSAVKLMKNLSHRGLFISCWLDSQEEADELVRKAYELAR